MKPFRRGYTLVEMMFAITLTSIVLATVGVMLHGVFRVQRTMADHTQFLDHLSRLAEQFRNDVHQAQSVEPAGQSCVVSFRDGKQIEYRVAADGISRTVRRGKEILGRDTHFLPIEFAGQWKLDAADAGAKPIATLIVSPVPRENAESQDDLRQFRIDAVVGLTPPEIRFAGGEK
jgi:prepilin-type N-terminal cleavage/methylation domain-containing protein